MVSVWLLTRDTDMNMLLTIHDELSVEIPDKDYVYMDEVKIRMEMEGVNRELLLPTPVDIKMSKTNWAEGVKL
jgi:DNA polymerase I-like protein with 3'-5' exonuclease and polymerase domains